MVQPHCLAIMRTIWSVWTQAWWPPLSGLRPPLTQSSLSTWLSQEPSDLSGLNPDSPPWLSCKFPRDSVLSFICRMVSAYFYCVLFTFCLLTDCIFCNIISIISLLSKHIIAVLLILEMYCRYYFDPQIGNNNWKCIAGIISILKLVTTTAQWVSRKHHSS